MGSSLMIPGPINRGALAQLGERLICIQEVSGSIPLSSTKHLVIKNRKELIININIYIRTLEMLLANVQNKNLIQHRIFFCA